VQKSNHSLHIVDDPIYAILWMLRQMPLDVAATYLALIAGTAAYSELISEEEHARLLRLVEEAFSNPQHRAA
jgi:lauroyl/myristoyl acyltransferase